MTIKLKTIGAEATILPERGGLLRNLKLTASDGKSHELLWLPPDFTASGSGWPGGGAPLCFPFAGRVFHDGLALQYSLDGVVRHMPLHGFGYGLPWQVVEQQPTAALLELQDSARTLELYPFAFRVRCNYQLSGTALTLQVQVLHRSESGGRMPVALGLHPYFRVPLGGAGEATSARLETSATEMVRVTPTGAAGKVTKFPESEQERRPTTDAALFQNLILGELESPTTTLVDPESKLKVSVSWRPEDPISYVVLWSQAGRGFYCVEPWMGLPDAVHSGLGLAWLEPGETLTVELRIALT